MVKKTLVTRKETPKGKNLKSIDKVTKKVTPNKVLIKKVVDKKLPGYIVVKAKEKAPFLKSKPDKTKKNNLDPKRKV